MQLRATKVLVMLTWIFLGIRPHFYTSINCLLDPKIFTVIFLCALLNEFSDITYHHRNMQNSADIDIINAYTAEDLILACKRAIKYCLDLVTLTTCSNDEF